MVKLFFGPPGCGKSTFAARIAYKNKKKGFTTFCNYPVDGCYLFDPHEHLGKYQIENCDVIIDEASIEFHSRNFKSFGDILIAFFKKNRHYNIRDIYIFSQGWDDIDKVIRILAVRLYVMKRISKHITMYRRISRDYGRIDPITEQLVDGYGYVPFSRRFIWMPKYWGMFDSFEHEELPHFDFPYIPTKKERDSMNSNDTSIQAREVQPIPTRETSARTAPRYLEVLHYFSFPLFFNRIFRHKCGNSF